jgi:hypothetical protein
MALKRSKAVDDRAMSKERKKDIAHSYKRYAREISGRGCVHKKARLSVRIDLEKADGRVIAAI